MPTQWIEPAIFHTYRGVDIYHIYKNDSIESGSRGYWYSTWQAASDDDMHGRETGVFDIHDLSSRPNESHKKIIERAIDDGYFKGWEGMPPELEPKTVNYNHMMDVAITVVSTTEDPDKLTPVELLDAMQARLDSLRKEWCKCCDLDYSGVLITEAFGHCDTYQEP